MEEPENEKVEGGGVSINAVSEDCVKEIRNIDDVYAKLKRRFLKRPEDVFSFKNGV